MAEKGQSVMKGASAAATADSEYLKKIDLKTDLKNMSQIEQIYVKKIIALNQERVAKAQRLKRLQRFVGLGITGFMLSIYAYSMYSVKQEKFLDDFSVPEPPDKAGQEYKRQTEAAIKEAATNPKAHH